MGGIQQQNVPVHQSRYLPKTHSLMASNAITIISARSMFGEDYPGDFGRWKIEAFKSILKTTDRNVTAVAFS